MKKTLLCLAIVLLFYTRFVGLNWGLPYPMHPDERNMSVAMQQLNCDEFSIFNFQFSIQLFRNCFNPNFFAYGQFPLYLGYLIVKFWHISSAQIGKPITFFEATMALRLISATASLLNIFVLIKIIDILTGGAILKIKNEISKLQIKDKNFLVLICQFTFPFLIFTFVPYALQFSHFGTTESLLMLLYSLMTLLSLETLSKRQSVRGMFLLCLFSGLAIATKVSSIIFLAVPILALFQSIFGVSNSKIREIFLFLKQTAGFLILSAIVAVIFSPHNILNWNAFLGSFNYESSVAIGAVEVFYTRQFENTVPFLFQMTKIFPYALGWPLFILAIMGFLGLSWKDGKINLLRLAFLVYFLPSAYLYAKWSRFMAPILPIMTLFAVLFSLKCCAFIRHSGRSVATDRIQNEILSLRSRMTFYCLIVLLLISILPGIAHLSIYQNSDVRFQASDWIYKNIPSGSYILSETANVVDIPIPSDKQPVPIRNYDVISFDFYNLDTNPLLLFQLQDHLKQADYILVPSRRLFANNVKSFPQLGDYYQKLFSGKLGFKKVAEFTSFPKISLFGKMLIEFKDEQSEETWTVFDHPVIRVYKRV